MALFLPLNIVQAEISENPKAELWYARNFVSVAPLNSIRSNIHKNTMTLFMSEVLYRVVKDQTNEDGLADWLKKQIMTLDALETSFANFHLLFLLELCGALGFSPETRSMAPFADEQLKHIEALLTKPFAEALMYPLKGAERNEIAECILKYIEYHTESTVNVRSLSVLRELYSQ